MSQYSEIMGSFIRTGNYPMEANYIFNSEEELKTFYANEIHKTTLHKGLLKIVASEREQTLFWVVEIDGKLQFEPLIQSESIDKLFSKIAELRIDLNNEINNRESDVSQIIGTDNLEDFQKGLDNLLAISNAIIQLQELSKSIPVIAGTEEKDIIEYLKTLDYSNLTEISNLLHSFFDTIDALDPKLNTLPEIQKFLEGFNYSSTLKSYLDNLSDSLSSTIDHRNHNLQTELDQTQVGVGLSGDGSFNADQETNYLKNATSVMNALKTLDGLIAQALLTSKLIPIETNTAVTTIDENVTNSNISVDVKVSNDSDIIVNNDGLYTKLTTEYDNGTLTIKVNGNVRSQHYLSINSIVDNAYYNPEDETLIIHFTNNSKVIIPAGKLIEEWSINNLEGSGVELTKVRVIDGPDVLSADIKVSPKIKNCLQKKSDGLYVPKVETDLNYIDGSLQYSVDGEIVKTIPLVDKLLVTPVLNVTWNITKQDNTPVEISNTQSRTLSLERGFKANGVFNFKWSHDNTKKDPISTNGVCGTVLPISEQLSNNVIVENITTNRTFTQNLVSPKSGFMVSGSNVILAQGTDTTSSSVSVSFTSKIYFGVSDSSNPSIVNLAGTKQQTTKTSTLKNITTTTEQYWSYAYPKDLGELTKITQNGASPVIEDFNKTEQTIVNDAGLSLTYYVYTSKNRGAFTNVELKFE